MFGITYRNLLTKVLFWGMVLGGVCVTLPISLYAVDTEAKISQQSVGLPDHTAGTVFVYSNQAWEKVVGKKDDQMEWVDYRGYRTTRPMDFVYRPSAWENKKAHGTRSYHIQSGIIFKKRTSLWPLKEGNQMEYWERNRLSQPDGQTKRYRYLWNCKVDGTENVSVLAGEFDTYRIIARKYYPPKGRRGYRLLETVTWYYAPSVAHYVKVVRKRHRKKNSEMELMAILPPIKQYNKSIRATLRKVFQSTLEGGQRDQPVRYQSDDSAVNMFMIPGKSFTLSNGIYGCRFVQEFASASGLRRYQGIAFRNSDGIWVVPKR
ncbi:MAG: hypothetical protein MI802_27205 [Desulfobacterales bacterium]|nr:hypothetical protein [Desulfobacterales bacterium]